MLDAMMSPAPSVLAIPIPLENRGRSFPELEINDRVLFYKNARDSLKKSPAFFEKIKVLELN